MIKKLSDKVVKAQWEQMLGLMLWEYREVNPDDTRNDREILTLIMDEFVDAGLIEKDENGKYIMGEIIPSS